MIYIPFLSGSFMPYTTPGFPYFAALVDATDIELAVFWNLFRHSALYNYLASHRGLCLYCIPRKRLSLGEHYSGGLIYRFSSIWVTLPRQIYFFSSPRPGFCS